jgi:hypothetical protein
MKTGFITPLYLSFSWILTVSYQLFTDTAVRSIGYYINLMSPAAGSWITINIDTIIFVYAFTWIFVLSSVIPSLLLGKERSVLIQYSVVLILTLLAVFIKDIIGSITGFQIQSLLSAASFLTNPILAVVYLLVPYLFMVGLDIRLRRKKVNAKKLAIENIIDQV